MFKKWHAYHSISALSHFTRYDMPRPFSDSSYYIDIIRNIFVDKYSTDVVEIELVYDISNEGGYFAVKIFPPKIWTKIKEIINVEEFVEWYSKRYEVKFTKRINESDNITKILYNYDDGYTRYSVRLYESPEKDFDKNYIAIEFQTYTGGRW